MFEFLYLCNFINNFIIMKNYLILLAIVGVLVGCTSIRKTMREPDTYLELKKDDFILSDQVSAEASSTYIFNVDFSRLFMVKQGVAEKPSELINIASIPILGNYFKNNTASYALYELMMQNTGYDVILYPQYEIKITRPLGIGLIYRIENVKVTARLGKLK